MINARIPSNVLVARIATDIIKKQHDLSVVQEQISTGKRVNRPSDEPAQAAQIIRMQEATSQLTQYQRNASNVESQLALEESALQGVSNVLNNLRELALSANSGAVDDYSRAAVNSAVKLGLDELYDLANAQDSFGNFLFGGGNTQTRPFAQQVPVNYSGGDEVHNVAVGLGRTIKTGDTGADVFMRIRNGNGDFSVQSDAGNTGSGIIGQGSVLNNTLYDGSSYRIEFTSASSYDIIDDSSGTAIQTGNTYKPAAAIEFNGIQTSIGGTPNAGDTFRIEPSANQDIFSTVSNFMNALEQSVNNPADAARMQQNVNEAIINLDSELDHINIARARVGSRLNSIDNSREENANIQLQLERTSAEIEDTDIAEAITSLQLQANTLEILQKTFSRLEGLSLFNYM